STVPSAANSFTSPPPVAPTRKPGSMRKSPIASPPNAPVTPTLVACSVDSATPSVAIPKVNALGTRRLRRSITALVAPDAATTEATTRSDVGGNDGCPQDVGDCSAESRHGENGADGDQRHQQAILEEVLSLGVACKAGDECEGVTCHGRHLGVG